MSSIDNDLRAFLKTLKVHNKDLDACFNDAVAVNHLLALFTQYKSQAVIEELERITGDRDGQVWCSMGDTIADDIKLEERLAQLKQALNSKDIPGE